MRFTFSGLSQNLNYNDKWVVLVAGEMPDENLVYGPMTEKEANQVAARLRNSLSEYSQISILALADFPKFSRDSCR